MNNIIDYSPRYPISWENENRTDDLRYNLPEREEKKSMTFIG